MAGAAFESDLKKGDGNLTGGQGKEDIPGRVMSKHSDVGSRKLKGFMGKSNGPIWPEGQNLANEKEACRGKRLGWGCGCGEES